MADWHELIIQAGFIFLVSYAIISDLRTLRVPNWTSVALATLFLFHSVTIQPGEILASHLFVGGVVLGVAFVLFTTGVFGGGDAKFLSALALWMGPAHIGSFLFITALLGGLTAVALLGLKKLLVLNPELEQRAAIVKPLAWARAGKMPYALPMGLAALMLGPRLF